MDYQIDWNNTICIHRVIKPKRKKVDQIYRMVTRDKYERIKDEAEKPEIIAKEELKNHEALIIELNQKDTFDYATLEESRTPKIGLVDVKIDETRQEMTGIQVLMRVGSYPGMFKEYTFSMSNYGKLWRAWTQYPTESQVWE